MAVTEGPGLIGALLVGLSAAKAIAFARGLPLVPVNHLHGHLAALYLQPEPVEPPFLALLASGGHTLILEVSDHRGYRWIGGRSTTPPARRSTRAPACSAWATRAAPGWSGSRPAATRPRSLPDGDARPPRLRPLLQRSEDIAPLRARRRRRRAPGRPGRLLPGRDRPRTGRAHRRAVADTGAATLAVVGGVARNGALRDAFAVRCRELGVRLALVAPELCSDNAAMIASAARYTDAIAFPQYLAPGRLRDRIVSVEVRVYSAAGCHLCEVAKALLEQEREAHGFDLVEIDITGRPELEAAYREQIPVVFVAGRKAFKYHVDPVELRRRLAAAAQRAVLSLGRGSARGRNRDGYTGDTVL